MNLDSEMAEQMLSDEVERAIEKEFSNFAQDQAALVERVMKMNLIHESLVVVERLDIRANDTFLYVPEQVRQSRLRLSYYGRVLGISMMDSGDEIQEQKKKILKLNDIVSFNPDSAYSLNVVVPKDMPEIWVVGVDNILMIDNGFDPIKARKKAITARVMEEKRRQNQNSKVFAEANKKAIEEQKKIIT